jgi:DNA repair protein RadD
MSSIWNSLGKAKLQQLIGVEVLDRLETLLPILALGVTSDSIYTKEGLASIFEAFSGASQLENKDFRAELFNSLKPEVLDSLLASLNRDGTSLDWSQKVKFLVHSWNTRSEAERIVDILGISKECLPRPASLPPSDVLLLPHFHPYKPLKEYQVPVATAAIKHLATPRSRFIIQMPTGSGKTRTAMEIIAETLNEQPDGTVIIWLAHSEELCEQAYDCFSEVWAHVARKPLRLFRNWGTKTSLPFDFKESAFVIGGFSKLYQELQKSAAAFNALSKRLFLLVADEAHKIIAPTYKAVTQALLGVETRVIGLTATPGRSLMDDQQNNQLAQFFFSEIVGLEGSNHGILYDLRAKKVLSEAEYDPLYTSQSYQLSAKEKNHLNKFFELPPGALERLADDDVRNVEIIRKLQKECSNGGQILFFGCSVAHSKFICAILNFFGIKASHLDGTTSRALRQSVIEDFRTKQIQVLCNYALLSTGFDAPKTDCVFISRPTGSIVLYSQMIGRGLRGLAIGGTAKCKIIDVIDNISGFSDADRVYHYFEEYFVPGPSN